MKRLTYDGIRSGKKVGIIFNNDGKAAFDRTIPSVGGIALRRLGASTHAVQTLLITLEKMSHRIRTMMVTSKETYPNLQILGSTLQPGFRRFFSIIASNYMYLAGGYLQKITRDMLL